MYSDFKTQFFKKLQKANKLFKRKQYFQSLEQYNACFKLFQNQKKQNINIEIEDLFFWIYSLRGMNYAALRQYQKAQADFNFVITKKPYDSTTLSRRVNLYIKLKQFKKALVDIEVLSQLQPDSIRVMALILQVKQKIQQSQGYNQQDKTYQKLEQIYNNDDKISVDEQQMLNFSNLKKIDRKSQIKVIPKRISQVDFKQDQIIQYNIPQNDDIKVQQQKPRLRLSKEQTIQILRKQQQQQRLLFNQKQDQITINIINRKTLRQPKKSILRKSTYTQGIQQKTLNSKSSNSKILQSLNIKDIQGKLIINHDKGVKFRSSKYVDQKPSGKQIRKSCLKKCSFSSKQNDFNFNTVKNKFSRNSSFTGLNIKNIEGKILKNEKVQQKQNESDQSDSSDQYNIFGTKKLEVSEKLKQQFGLNTQIKNQESNNKNLKISKKSILKKCSFVIRSDLDDKKGKKSVIFRQ